MTKCQHIEVVTENAETSMPAIGVEATVCKRCGTVLQVL